MSDMQQFISKLVGFLSFQSLILVGCLTPYFLNYKTVVATGFMAATVDKHALLEKPQSKPRVIFVGGSSFAFGNNSPEIGKQLNYVPINMGLHAGVGLEFMLREVEGSLRAKDIVVISPEYENFTFYPEPPGAKDVFDVVESRWQNAQFVPLNYVPSLLDKGLILTGGVLRRSLAATSGPIERKVYYQRSSFNDSGDAVAHYTLPSLTQKVARDQTTYTFDSHTVQGAINAMNAFNARCQAKGVHVFFAYPPLIKRLLEASRPEIKQVEQQLAQSLDFPILDKPEDVAFPDSYYFDTRYHLNQIGSQARSQHLATQLSQQLAKLSPQATAPHITPSYAKDASFKSSSPQ